MKKVIVKFISFMLITSMFLSLCSFSAISSESSLDKISLDLQSKLETYDDNDYIPVEVFLNAVDKSKVYKAMESKGYNSDIYTSDEKLLELAEIALHSAPLQSANLIEEATSKYSIEDPSYTAVEIIRDELYNEYKMLYRSLMKSAISGISSSFLKQIDLNMCEIVYQGVYSPSLTMNVKKSYLMTMASMSSVENILHREEFMATDQMANTTSSNSNQRKMSIANNSSYYGNGVVVGVIESADDEGANLLDTTSPHLASGIASGRISWIDNPTIEIDYLTVDEHATNVVSIIAGAPVTVNGVTYQGVVPNATVVGTYINGVVGLEDALDIMIANGADVINASFSYYNQTAWNYSINDLYVDKYIEEYGVSFVTSAGNLDLENSPNYRIKSPALAFNCITVGNADLTTSSPYSMNISSCYNQSTPWYLPNKPDIVAAGTDIYGVKSVDGINTVKNLGSGTSYSSPYIVGIVARMMQVSTMLKSNPALLKAKLMLAADNSLITGDTPCKSAYSSGDNLELMVKSGAGLVNGSKALVFANSVDWFNNFQESPTTSNTYMDYLDFDLMENDTIKIVYLIFRTNNAQYSNNASIDTDTARTNIDIRLVNSAGNVIAKSESLYNNVEIIECQVDAEDTYTLQIRRVSLDASNELDSITAWYIEEE